MTKIKIALAQMRCEKGDWQSNLLSTDEYMARAAAEGCDIIVLPEAGLSGYCDPAKFPEAVQTLDSPLVTRFAEMTARHGIAASGGFLEANPGGKPFVTQVLANRGRIVGAYRKINIIEEDAVYYASGSETPVFRLELPGGTVMCGLAVCSDSERADIFQALAEKGARIVFHSSAPGLYGRRTSEAEWWDGYNWYRSFLGASLPLYARENGIYIVVATQTGPTVDEDFPGGSFVFGPDGSLLAATEDYSEQMLVHMVDLS